MCRVHLNICTRLGYMKFMEQYENNKKSSKRASKKSKRKEKLDMYDMILANLIAGSSIIEPTVRLDNSQLAIGFSNIASASLVFHLCFIKILG